jgi:hypothetical protein
MSVVFRTDAAHTAASADTRIEAWERRISDVLLALRAAMTLRASAPS